MEFEKDLNRTRLGIVRAGQHPNVAAAVVVGLGCEHLIASEVAAAIEDSGKPAECILIQEEGGTSATIEKGVSLVHKLRAATSGQQRTPRTLSDLIVGVQCGGSDWTTAIAGNTAIGAMTELVVKNGGTVLITRPEGFPGSEHILAEHAVSREVGKAIFRMVDEMRAEFRARYGQGIEEVNPTPGNKAGGVTTLVEKTMGTIKKAGSAPIQGIIALGQPIPRPGLWILDSRARGSGGAGGPDAFMLTALAMQGAHLAVFSTGRGTPVGSAVMPVVKITGNPDTYRRLKENMDFNAGVILQNGATIEETGKELYRLVLEVANGKLTRSETLGHFEYSIPREPS